MGAALQNVVESAVADKVSNGDMFTTYDITKEVRSRGHRENHHLIKQVVHAYFEQGLMGGVCRVRERRRRRPLPSEPYLKVALHTAQADHYPPCFPRPCRAWIAVSPRGPFAGPLLGRI
jgi:hypothetical protein